MDWSVLSSVFRHIADTMPVLVLAVLLLMLTKAVFKRSMKFSFHDELVVKGNPAFGVLFAAFMMASAIAVSGAFFGMREIISLAAAGELLGDGLLAILLLRISVWINDRFILGGFCISKEIAEDRNLGVGFVVAGSVIACGLVINGSLAGFSASYWLGIRDIILFWGVGQLALVIGARLFRRLKRYDVHRLIEFDDNAAVGLSFGGFLIGIGVIVRGAVIGSGLGSLGNELIMTLAISGVGVCILAILHALISRLLLGGVDLVEEVEMKRNQAVGGTMGAVTIGLAILIAELLKR